MYMSGQDLNLLTVSEFIIRTGGAFHSLAILLLKKLYLLTCNFLSRTVKCFLISKMNLSSKQISYFENLAFDKELYRYAVEAVDRKVKSGPLLK